MASMDYQTAFYGVPYRWIIKYLKLIRICNKIISLTERL